VSAYAQFTGNANKGLVGVGRLSGNTFDALGVNVDTLGGIFSTALINDNDNDQTINKSIATL
jgi:hypothetical protein